MGSGSWAFIWRGPNQRSPLPASLRRYGEARRDEKRRDRRGRERSYAASLQNRQLCDATFPYVCGARVLRRPERAVDVDLW
jgi:hypothetical protein